MECTDTPRSEVIPNSRLDRSHLMKEESLALAPLHCKCAIVEGSSNGILGKEPLIHNVLVRMPYLLYALNGSNDDTRDLHCMTTSTLGNNELLVAGQQDELLVVNVNYGSISRKIAGAANTVVMKKAASSRLICCGSMAGEVTLRDPRTMNIEQRVQAHTGTLSDLEISGNMMLTCGFSNR